MLEALQAMSSVILDPFLLLLIFATTIIGVIIGAALMQVLQNAITLIDWIPDTIQYAVIGGVILAGAMADEVVRRTVGRRIGSL